MCSILSEKKRNFLPWKSMIMPESWKSILTFTSKPIRILVWIVVYYAVKYNCKEKNEKHSWHIISINRNTRWTKNQSRTLFSLSFQQILTLNSRCFSTIQFGIYRYRYRYRERESVLCDVQMKTFCSSPSSAHFQFPLCLVICCSLSSHRHFQQCFLFTKAGRQKLNATTDNRQPV